jgi:hypothetical protein
MTYDELALVRLVRTPGGKIGASIPLIWVNSAASLAGGRALWGIPKELAEFGRAQEADMFRGWAAAGEVPIAAFTYEPSCEVPGRRTVTVRFVQEADGSPLVSPGRLEGRMGVGRGRWSFRRDGPLGFLDGMTPLATVRFSAADMTFG